MFENRKRPIKLKDIQEFDRIVSLNRIAVLPRSYKHLIVRLSING